MKEEQEKKNKSGIFSILTWISLGLIAFLFFVSISLLTINNIPFLRKPVVHSIVQIVNTQLLAKIEIGDLKFRSHNTIRIKDFTLTTANDTLAHFDELKVKIKLFSLFNNEIIVRYLEVKNPIVKILRSKIDGKWNFEKIAPPSEPSASSGKSPLIKILYLSIQNGRLQLKDSTFMMESLPFNPLDLNIQTLYLKLKADLNLDGNVLRSKFENVSFYENNTDFQVDSLNFSAYLDSTKIAVNNFKLDIPGTEIKIHTKINEYSPLSSEKFTDFNKGKFIFKVNAESFNTSTLKKFVYVPFNSGIKADFNMVANGDYNVLKFSKLDMKLRNSILNSSGKLRNFMSEDIIYDFVFRNSTVKEEDIKSLLDIDLSSIPQFNNAKIIKLAAIGDVNKVSTDYDINSDIGNAIGTTSLEYFPDFKYAGKVDFRNLNFAPILQDNSLVSNISGFIEIDGKGYDPSKMNTKITLKLSNSEILGRNISEFSGNITMADGTVLINEFIVKLGDRNENSIIPSLGQELNITGEMNIKDINNPKYSIALETTGLNLAKLIQNNELPSSLSGKIQIEGDGFSPDSLQLNLKSHFEEISFPNLSLLPIDLNLEIASTENNNKEIYLKFGEDFIKVKGQIETTKLMNSLSDWIDYASLFIDSRYEQFIEKKFDTEKEQKLNKIAKEIQIPPINADIFLKLNNLSLLNKFIPDLGILSSIQTKSQIISSPDNLIIDFTNIEIGNTIINSSGLNIVTDPFSFSGILNLTKPDSIIQLSYFNVSLDELDTIKINGTKITEPVSDIYMADSTFILDFNAKFDTLASANLSLAGIFNRDNIIFDFKKINLDYLNKVQIKSDNIGRIRLDNSSFLIDNLILNGNNKERIAIYGTADTNTIEKLVVEVSNLQLKNFKDILPTNLKEILKDIDFHLDKSQLEISGNLNSPIYHFKLNANEIISKNKQLGALVADLNYQNINLSGRMELLNDYYGELPPLRFDLQKFPIDLSFTDNIGKIEGDYLAKIGLDSLNIQILEPIQPFVKNIRGYANAQISINGSDFENYHLNGYLNTNELNFKLMQNNLDYIANSRISFQDQKIKIDTLQIINFGTKNSARLSGSLKLAQNSVSEMDLKLKADNFLLLDEHSRLVNPQFFGKVSLSTKNEGVNLTGTPENINIIGDLQVNPSNLTIANLSGSNVVTQTNFDYVLKDDKRIFTVITTTDTLTKPNETKIRTTNGSVPDINVNVFIPKSVNLKIELGAIGEIVAILGTTDPTIPLKYVMSDSKPDGQLFGELIIKNGSTLNSYKKMSATGTISFNTGRLDAPELNLTARYDGKIEDNSNPIKYSVFIYITGTPELPKVRFDYTINNLAPQAEQKKIEENALYLLLFGTLPGSSEIIDPAVVSKLGSAGISSIASRSISDLLLKTGVIESADVQLNSEDFEKTKINLKGKLFGSMNWSFGGNVADLTKNNQIVIEIPLSVDSKTFNQVVWLMSYSTNLNSTTIDPDEKNWEIKFRIGGSW